MVQQWNIGYEATVYDFWGVECLCTRTYIWVKGNVGLHAWAHVTIHAFTGDLWLLGTVVSHEKVLFCLDDEVKSFGVESGQE